MACLIAVAIILVGGLSVSIYNSYQLRGTKELLAEKTAEAQEWEDIAQETKRLLLKANRSLETYYISPAELGHKYVNDFRVSEDYKLSDFASPDTGEVKISRRLVEICQQLRDGGIPFKIRSAYRTPEHNTYIGGAPQSYHMKGLAIDLEPLKLASQSQQSLVLELAKQAMKFPDVKGIGFHEDHLHIDLRPWAMYAQRIIPCLFWVVIPEARQKWYGDMVNEDGFYYTDMAGGARATYKWEYGY